MVGQHTCFYVSITLCCYQDDMFDLFKSSMKLQKKIWKYYWTKYAIANKQQFYLIFKCSKGQPVVKAKKTNQWRYSILHILSQPQVRDCYYFLPCSPYSKAMFGWLSRMIKNPDYQKWLLSVPLLCTNVKVSLEEWRYPHIYSTQYDKQYTVWSTVHSMIHRTQYDPQYTVWSTGHSIIHSKQ